MPRRSVHPDFKKNIVPELTTFGSPPAEPVLPFIKYAAKVEIFINRAGDTTSLPLPEWV